MHNEHHNRSYDRNSHKTVEENINFKHKLGLKKNHTTIGYEEPQKVFEFKPFNDDLSQPPTSMYTNHSSNLYSDFKMEALSNKDSLTSGQLLAPVLLAKNDSGGE